ncbi:hypothetical protein BG842_15435 [Haladaptatus sp. W1]|uniref:hypothetical protein n=1 Tax=Haladaptatus sp. W1 TaxID=1897478 RepID=UPI000849CEC5|nr:hypothetical protein [Haladaptatus sp. W1]ODR79334.1 hypothetical protein BG842_15435 [Haladaptatus sp. W1]
MGILRTVEVGKIEQPEQLEADVFVELASNEITLESTAKLEIGVKWLGEPTALYFGQTSPIELPKRCSEPDDGLVLLPYNHGFERKGDEPECWRINLTPDDDFGHALGLQRIEVDEGEILSCRVEVWGDHRSDSCLSPGEYSFSDVLSSGDTCDTQTWSFDIRINSVSD